VTWTQEQDQKNMMDQLGIKTLRPGANGNESAPDHSNYDESKANPWPDYPDALTLKSGQKVTTAETWWKVRRPEIVADFDSEMYGRVPKNVPRVTWTAKVIDHEFVGRTPAIAKHLIGHVDNSAYPLIDVNIDMVVVTPANVHGPVPVLMMFGRPVLPAPAQPNSADLERSMPHCVRCWPAATLRSRRSWTSIRRISQSPPQPSLHHLAHPARLLPEALQVSMEPLTTHRRPSS
jgi:hypothetical protein